MSQWPGRHAGVVPGDGAMKLSFHAPAVVCAKVVS